MDKYSTCLTPFTFYLLSLLANGTLIKSAGDKYNISKNKNVSRNSRLEERKRTLFEETIKFSLLNDKEKKSFLDNKVKVGSSPCGLCLACIGCEHEYWKNVYALAYNGLNRSEYTLPKEINELLLPKEKPEEIYVKNYLLTRQMNSYHNKLVMLKGFSSSTPFLLNHSLNTNYYSGGGFFSIGMVLGSRSIRDIILYRICTRTD